METDQVLGKIARKCDNTSRYIGRNQDFEVARVLKKEAVGSFASSRPKTLKRRKELLGVVYESISEHGIDGVSMRQIAEAAGISTGTINYHFKNKHNLVISALEAAYELPEDWQDFKGSPFSQLQHLAMGYVFRSPRERFWRFWINYTAHSSRDEVMRQHQNLRYERQLKFWADLLRAGIDAEEIDPSIDPDATANQLLLTAHGLVIRQLQSPAPSTREDAKALLTNLFEGIARKRLAERPKDCGRGKQIYLFRQREIRNLAGLLRECPATPRPISSGEPTGRFRRHVVAAIRKRRGRWPRQIRFSDLFQHAAEEYR
ncbi:TetR/AcrR family transcriptional regulator [Bradyrhizobium sp. RDT10]